jgi:hypothetical protein
MSGDLGLEAPSAVAAGAGERGRALAEAPLDRQQLRLKLESAEATIEALEQLRLIMGSATRRVRTPTGVSEQPDWSTRLKACRLVLALASGGGAMAGDSLRRDSRGSSCASSSSRPRR